MKTFNVLTITATFSSKLSLLLALISCASFPSQAADPVFSGPQPGEKITPFKVVTLAGPAAGKEYDPVSEHKGAPSAFVFIHGVERSMVPILRVLDQYGHERKDRLKMEFVFLSADRAEAERRFPAVGKSLSLQSRMGLSTDGIEGPGNFGLNKECLLTIVAAREDRVTANFALIQPGISDAPKIIEALALTIQDEAPPTVAQLEERRQALTGRPSRPAGERMNPRMADPAAAKATDPFPGAVPTDEKLLTLLRRFIQPTNDEKTVNNILQQVEEHIQGKPDLTQQAVDGWTRILHFGDRYGTPYAREAGRGFLDRHKKKS